MKRFFLLIISMVTVMFVTAQGNNLTVSSLQGTSVGSILQDHLAGDGVLLSGCQYPNINAMMQPAKFNGQTGNVSSPQIGTFNRNGFTNFPISTGLVMTTGNVSVAAGPNSSTSASSPVSPPYIESALNQYTTGTISSSASLEFDFIAMADTFCFNYVFASEEYCEFVNQPNVNDVFAFLLTGIDPVTFQTTTRNVAVVPGSITASNPNGTPVAISNVNHGYFGGSHSPTATGSSPSNSQYFICNGSNSNGVQYDGYTTKLAAQSTIFSCNTYHMKLAIANLGDQLYDSGVFLEEGSFYSPHVRVEQAWESEQGGDTLIQNCRNLDLTFSIEHPFITAYTSVIIQTGGDAVLGVDYSLTTDEGMELTVDNNEFFYQPGDTVELVHVTMLPTVTFTNPDQVKTAELYIVTQGCNGFPDLMDVFYKKDTIILHLQANDSVRLRDTAFVACDTLTYMEVQQVRGTENLSFQWSPATNIADPESLATACAITQSGTYHVVASDRWECMTDTATVEVTVVPRPDIDITYTPDHGCQPLPVTWQAQYSPDYATLHWTIYNDSSYTYVDSAVTLHTSLPDEGYYSAKLVVTSQPGCSDSLTLENVVHVAGYPHADFLFSPSEPQNGEEVFFYNQSTGTNLTDFVWNFGDGHSSYVQDPSHAYHLQESDLMTVRLTVTNSDGCSDDTIQVVPVEDNFAFYVPSAFTPNTDGVNEVFLPKVNGVANYEFVIYSRDGELIFYTNNPEQGWDGTLDGKPAPQGVYVWKINYARIGTPEEMKARNGSVTLVR
ncbi:MAG: choice-of-anchor L domain-containing protein [Bacteroidales bacterium]|nr:choice-of-anchor L domain-containing protein [Bacteroidales bacterium]